MTRLLITGSRTWTHEQYLQAELRRAHDYLMQMRGEEIILVSGACPTGVDAMAERYWESLGLRVQRFPAVWRPYGIYNPQAGKVRNHHGRNAVPHRFQVFQVTAGRPAVKETP